MTNVITFKSLSAKGWDWLLVNVIYNLGLDLAVLILSLQMLCIGAAKNFAFPSRSIFVVSMFTGMLLCFVLGRVIRALDDRKHENKWYGFALPLAIIFPMLFLNMQQGPLFLIGGIAAIASLIASVATCVSIGLAVASKDEHFGGY
ncbi:hypothetical protein JNK13_09645 [bacterium]|nr:hypothetical protein [bacterium]